jgi:hypothetical protein
VVVDSSTNGGGAEGRSERSLRILLVLRAENMDRVTEGFLRCGLARGHSIHVVLEQRKAGRADSEKTLFDEIAAEYPSFSCTRLPAREEPWLVPATRLRYAIDYLRYLEPQFAGAETLRERARSRVPWYVRLAAATRLLKVRPLRRGMDRLLRALERRMPLSEQSVAMLRKLEPDVVLVSPLVELGSPQGDHLRAADALGIPTGLVVASWDNLTTKGAIRDVPDVTIVWNEDQVREAIEFHGLPAGSVRATGAHSHDHWFSWKPSTSGEEFAEKVGLGPERRFVLYVCSSGFIAGDDEVEFVREWVRRLGASGDEALESLGVLIRPHPQNVTSWQEADLDDPGRVVVWPRAGAAPTDRQSKDDYFDSLYHAAAVVGINTTALVDTAIVRRPVFTVVDEHFRSTQTGTLHFSYLARDDGSGLLNVARSWDEHLGQLGSLLRETDGHHERIEGFLRAFVRPHGLDQPAAPLALDAVERVATVDKEPVRQGGPLRWLWGAVANLLGRTHLARKRVARKLRKRLGRRATRKRMHRWRKTFRGRLKRSRRRGALRRPTARRRQDARGRERDALREDMRNREREEEAKKERSVASGR